MEVRVTTILVPGGSTIGIGRGVPTNDATKVVVFAGDWRQMAQLALAASEADAEGLDLVVEVPDWAVLEVREP